MNTKLTLIAVLAGLTLIFVLQNLDTVQIRFLFWTVNVSQALFMVLLMIVGVVIGWLLNSFFRRRRQPSANGTL